MNILLAFDRNVVGPVAACLKSIAMTNPTDEIDVYLLHSRLRRGDEDRLRSFADEIGLRSRFIAIDETVPSAIHKGLPISILPTATLFRCFLAETIPADVERILYLDCDTLVMNSLRPLYDVDLQGKVAAVVHNCGPDPEIGAHLVDLGVDREDYFNAGVMLIDLAKWRRLGLGDKILDVFREHGRRLRFHDQCALNIALHGDLRYLPRKYNYRPDIFWRTQDFEIPVIVHYAHVPKPWNNPGGAWGGLYIEIAGMTPWPVPEQLLREIGVPRLKVHRRRFLKAIGLRK